MLKPSNLVRAHRRIVLGACLLLFAASCSGGASPTPTSPSVPIASEPAPSELQGTWLTVLRDGSNQTVALSLGERTYGIRRGPNSATGQIGVRGAEIDFFGSNLCTGTGTYRWVLSGNSLRFAGSDVCGGRIEVLDGYTYTKQ